MKESYCYRGGKIQSSTLPAIRLTSRRSTLFTVRKTKPIHFIGKVTLVTHVQPAQKSSWGHGRDCIWSRSSTFGSALIKRRALQWVSFNLHPMWHNLEKGGAEGDITQYHFTLKKKLTSYQAHLFWHFITFDCSTLTILYNSLWVISYIYEKTI